jgi:hypothetical protein
MSDNFVSFLRSLAAILICLSGMGLIAGLWLRELTGLALADALLGSVYLIIGIGLFGRSRFSLFMGIVTPATVIALLLNTVVQPDKVLLLRITIDAVVILFSTIVLWHVRHHPSV